MPESIQSGDEFLLWLDSRQPEDDTRSRIVLLTKFVEGHLQNLYEGDMGALNVANRLSACYWEMGEYEKSRSILQHIFEVVSYRYPTSDAMLLFSAANYAQCLAALGEYELALEVIKQSSPWGPDALADGRQGQRLLLICRLMLYLGEFQLALTASESLVAAGARGSIDRQTVSLAKRSALKAKVGARAPDGKELAMKKVAKDISKGKFPFRS